ncbi:MAG: SH3 domain-containing protein [Bacteroidales bacterium]|nr:SH3 domain-containing protein [Bacteroidales bacterium]MBN2756779.1 SH3 domain-containing protein [Bacteroidales bacterium]
MTEKKKSKKIIIGRLALGIIPLLFIVYLVIGPVFQIIKQDILAENMYIISDFVNVRAKADTKSLKMGKIDFGTEVLVYNIKNEWAEVLIDGQKGYIHQDFIGNANTYYKLDGLFGDNLSARKLSKLNYKLAIIRYLDSAGYISNIKDGYKKEFSDEDLNKEKLQIFSPKYGSRYNSVDFADFNGDFSIDIAIVFKNINTGKNHLVILGFDKHDPLNKSKEIYSMDLMEDWYFIRTIKKRNKKYLTNKEGLIEKQRIPIDAIEIGTNRNKELNDTEYLLIYNGEKFELIDQTPPENEK